MKWSEQIELKAAIDRHGMELLAFHQTAEWNSMDRFGVQKNIMITVSMTLIAAGAAAVSSDSQIIVLAAMLVPAIVAVLRQYTIEILDRYYARFLEAVVAQRKLRFILGLGSDREAPFDEDEFLEVARRGNNAAGTGSALWVREYIEKGHNNVVWRIFRGLCWASAILPVAAGARLYTWSNDAVPNCSLTAPVLIVAVIVVSLIALGYAYAVGTGHITKSRDDMYGKLPNKAMQTDRPSAGR
jgi:hypothetical protein